MKKFVASLSLMLLTNVVLAAVIIEQTSRTFERTSNVGSITTSGTGSWAATTTEPWITFSRASGEAGTSCIYKIAANHSADTRIGVILIGDFKYTVTQKGCDATVAPTSIIVAGVVLQIYQNGKHSISASVVGSGSVRGCGQYETGEQIMVSAEAASGFTFSHWNGDADGYNASITITVDEDKEIVANFIPDQAAQKITADKAGEAGLYTRDQIHALEMGNLVFDVDASGTARVGVKLMETSDLSDPNSWKPATLNGNPDVGPDGTVGMKVKAEGNAKFFKVVMPE